MPARLSILLLIILFLSDEAGMAQSLPQPSSIAKKDSLLPKNKAARRWHPYAGIYFTGDAGMYYIGPGFQAGLDYRLKKHLLISAGFHYFGDQLHTRSTGFFEDGKYRSYTAQALLQWNSGRQPEQRSFFVAGGLALQHRRDTAITSYDQWDEVHTYVVPAMRSGYYFPLGKYQLSTEINLTGPYTYGDASFRVLEIFSQVAIGCRFIF